MTVYLLIKYMVYLFAAEVVGAILLLALVGTGASVLVRRFRK